MPLRAFVFDAYGTLFDVHAAIARHRDAVGPSADRMSELWRAKQLEYTWTHTLAGRYLDFWTLTERALDYALARIPPVDPDVKGRLMDAYLTLDAYADARPVLEALKGAGFTTAILSNGAPRMLSAAVEAAKFGTLLNAVISVDTIRMFKPRPEVYGLVTDGFMLAPDEVVFVSSNRWDVMGAAAFGLQAIWVNRARLPDEYPDHPPAAVLRDLAGLTTLLKQA